MLLSMSVAGLSFVGADVGGFFKHPDKQLITRWHQFGALAYPFYRSHAHLETPRREPWMYDDEVVEHVRSVGRLRYSFLPLWYTLFAEHSFQGQPIVRPLWWDHMSDLATYESVLGEKSLVVGKDLLVVAALDPKEEPSVEVLLPGPENWYDFWTGVRHQSGRMQVPNSPDHVPLFVRAGAVVCRKLRARRSTQGQIHDPYTVAIFTDESGSASGRLYVDDGNSNAYENGAFVYQEFVYGGGSLRSEPRTLGSGTVRNDIAQKADLLTQVGLGIERIDVHGTAHTSAVLRMAGEAPVPLTTMRRDGVLIVKLPPVKVGTHGWEIAFGGEDLVA
jgi:alpha 1,3-glucosidase